ncbi:hypothetical protein CFBP5507_14760 [Agrobacterium salinitolerans]|uniref:Uncharacterized protein n=1 Tax=Agrobacterium salinitolerans TaxID=1183413 RepID=A0A9X9KCK0_9HYPH|nr:hypothetical protein [Agrobacterium salinitolerans]UYZ08989.1 hypothetical protein CFBP5507_14760 [Agrobacterium salinitolerans]
MSRRLTAMGSRMRCNSRTRHPGYETGPLDGDLSVLAATIEILGHVLLLHGIHAGQTPDALLVQLDWSPILPAYVNQPNRLNKFVFEAVLEQLDDSGILDGLHGFPPDKRAGNMPARPDLSGR